MGVNLKHYINIFRAFLKCQFYILFRYIYHWMVAHPLKPKLLDFIKWVVIDIYRAVKNGIQFEEFGVTLFVNRQGAGKTVSMVEYLERIRHRYPECMILTNFGYAYETKQLEGWCDLLNIRNGKKGVVFAIDEIHSEFSSNDWKNFPPELLREISQQRKQKIKIIASVQNYKDTAVQIRRQTFDVVECKCILKRWVWQRCFDADEYNSFVDSQSLEKKTKLHRKWRRNWIMTDYIRELFNSEKKIERIRAVGFQERQPVGEGTEWGTP